MVGIAFGGDAQPESIEADGLSKVNLEDFDRAVLDRSGGGDAAVSAAPIALREVFRYGEAPGSLRVQVAPVAPDVRVETTQTLSLGEERMVLAIDLVATITRAGLFELSFPLDDGLEVEAASGAALSHFIESGEGDDGPRVITLHLNGRTVGEQAFTITVTGPAALEQGEWAVPRFALREATRQKGQLLIVPEKGLRARPGTRTNVSPLDARTISGNRPGALAFRLLQADWNMTLELEKLDAWVTSEALQEVTLREGLTKTRLIGALQVENAAVQSIRVRLPGLDADSEGTVRASGAEVSDIMKLEGSDEVWEMRFKRRVLGGVEFEIAFQRASDRTGGTEALAAAEIIGAGQPSHWLAVRASSHLDVQAGETGRGWQAGDWPNVPGRLASKGDPGVPALVFRVVEPEAPLNVSVKRHAVAEALSLRVSEGNLTTVFSPDGTAVSQADLRVEVVEKSTMEVRLPEGAKLFNAFVNGQSASIVRESGAYLFYVVPQEGDRAANVSMAWAVTGDGTGSRIRLRGPDLNVPMQNITWDVVLPQGYELRDAGGTLELVHQQEVGAVDLDGYRKAFRDRRTAEAQDASQLLQEAHRWKNSGQQQRARSALRKLSKDYSLDEAANEDARVQLRELQTEQAILGLNTRRQRLYLANVSDDTGFARNEQLEAAAGRNPLLQGNLDYDPQEVDELLGGNTNEENSALRTIASRLVSQQLAAEPAPKAIGITLPRQGAVASFSRSIQVDGAEPLELDVRIKRQRNTSIWGGALSVGAALIVLAAFAVGSGDPRKIGRI
jgi:uncharacterized protein YigA (DUF484 family)